MKIQIKGELTIPELQQSIYEQLRELEDRFAVRFVKNTTIYFTTTNGFGDRVYCRDARGKEVTEMICNGPYRSAAEKYDGL